MTMESAYHKTKQNEYSLLTGELYTFGKVVFDVSFDRLGGENIKYNLSNPNKFPMTI